MSVIMLPDCRPDLKIGDSGQAAFKDGLSPQTTPVLATSHCIQLPFLPGSYIIQLAFALHQSFSMMYSMYKAYYRVRNNVYEWLEREMMGGSQPVIEIYNDEEGVGMLIPRGNCYAEFAKVV